MILLTQRKGGNAGRERHDAVQGDRIVVRNKLHVALDERTLVQAIESLLNVGLRQDLSRGAIPLFHLQVTHSALRHRTVALFRGEALHEAIVVRQPDLAMGHPRSKDVMRRPDNDIHSRLGRRRVSRSRATRKSSRCVGHFIVEIDRDAPERSGVLRRGHAALKI